jgi:NTP pyrophosphatase (non-canonical NTP hydrolase)
MQEQECCEGTAMVLTFNQVRKANRTRCAEKFHDVEEWSSSDWGNAMAGEFGEVAQELFEMHSLQLQFFAKLKACDTIKKQLRQMQGDAKYAELKKKLAKELADVVLYADLLSEAMGLDLGEAVREKFNEVSVKRGSKIKL